MTWSSPRRQGGPGRGTRVMVSLLPVFTRLVVPLYRLTGGRLVERATQGAPLVLVTTVGRRTGRRRTAALGHVRDGDDVIVMASNGGRPETPAWVHNLRARPEAEVFRRGDRYPARAIFLEGDEWQRQWDRLIAAFPMYEQGRLWAAPREIPLIRLQRSGSSDVRRPQGAAG
jgi:deazaflavin-dependent oxidoreductase (nitroreductase family)